jgi:hypothetical protein
MNRTLQFGEEVEGYQIRVLNEREIRASAGIWFLATFAALMAIIYKANFLLIKYVITLFFADFLVRVFISPRYSPTLIIGRMMVSNQVPEYVGARQKKFAWTIGLILSATMFVLMVIVNSFSPVSGIICMLCLLFLYFESVFGICIACKFYKFFYREKVQYCPGEVCEVKSRQEIQKISPAQVLVVIAFIVLVVAAAFLLKAEFSKKPFNLFKAASSVAR